MHVVVIAKRVPDLVEDLVIDSEGRALDPDETEYKLNEFDDQALEQALLIKDAHGCKVSVLMHDADGVDKILYTALAKGADSAIKVCTDAEELDGNFALAQAMAAALGTLDYDLVLTGVQGADDRDGQLGPLLASLLDVPCVNVASGVSAADGAVTVHKEYSGGKMARFSMALPGLLGIQAAAQSPRYVPVSKVRAVQKEASLQELEVEGDFEPLSRVAAMSAPEQSAGAKMLGGAPELLALLKEQGVVS
ncbi:MAG: hypothetical protein OEZ06_03670 [Myxococcales bacterium]|nr:hypothetical protein [Myxococcales bacterium]